jgi:DNA-binding beta-propeller fold protein YncE
LTLEVNPGDALIVLNASIPATESGSFVRDAVEPGVHRFTVSRTGFETRTLDIDARRFRGANRRVDLTALPVHFSLSASPANASIRVSRQGSELAAEQGSLSTTIPAGEVTLLITAPGRNDYERTLFLDTATSLEVRLDPEGQLVHGLSLIACAGAPKAVALTPDGTEAWATILNGPPSIEIFDPRSGARSGEVDLGTHGAVEIVFSADGTRAYASQMETARVFEIDVRSRRTLRAFDTQSAWTKVVALAADGTTLYAANWSGDDVSEIDLASGRLLRRIPVADTPRGLWPSADGTTLWVASFGTGDLERVDLNSGKVSRVFKNPGGALRHLVADETRGVLFASDMAKDCVWATDMRSGMTRRFATVGHKPNTIDLSPDGRILFVSNRGANNPVSYYLPGPEWGSVLLLDARTGRTLDGIVGGNQCTALDVSGDGRTLVFSDFLDDRLRVYEVPPHGQLAAGEGGRSKTLARDVRK